jgi:hypothetical protein
MDLDTADPKGLIRESYAIGGIGPAECRSIFLDWALSLGPGAAPAGAAAQQHATYPDGRDHHPKGFTMWLAGGGIRGGLTYGATDEFGYNAVEKKVSVPDG